MSGKKKAIQVLTSQMSSKTTLIGLSIFWCGKEKPVHGRPWELAPCECTSQIIEDFASWCKLKTFRRSLNNISTFRANLIISRLRMFNHVSLALKLNTQNANGSIIDVQWFKSSFGVSFFICSRLATTSYLRQKDKASTDTGEANSKRYVWLLSFFIWFWNGIPKCMEKPKWNCNSYHNTQRTETFVSMTRTQKRWSNCDN